MRDESETSKASFALGGILAVVAVYTLVTMLVSSLAPQAPALFIQPGAFLRAAFSWACLFVPTWFAAAALVAVLPGFHPGAIAALAGSILPFIPLAAFARLTEDPAAAFAAFPFLEAAGMPAIGIAAAALVLAISALVCRAALALSRRSASARERGTRPGLLLAPPVEADVELEEATVAGRRPPESETDLDGSEAPFAFRVPELPPVPPLQSITYEKDPADRSPSAEKDDTRASIAGAETSGAASDAPHDCGPDDPPAVDAIAPAKADSSSGSAGAEQPALLELAGARPIEFTSVPPAPASTAPTEEEKEAAIKRILARRKDKPYAVPVDGILNAYPDGQYWIIDDKTRHSAEVLRDTLAEFNIEAEVTGIRKGPVITMFEILPAPGVKLSKITNLADNIALRLAASSVRIVAPIPGKHAVGIEVPNEHRSIVSLREIVENETFKTAKMEIPVILGKDIAGEVQFIDLVQTPHLLIAGATGSGKSVCVNSIILSILFRRSPEQVRLLLIDPKIVELKLYNDIPHLLTPVITEPKRAFQALQYCICEMERRYTMLDRVGVRDVKSYNRRVREKGLAQERLPYIVVIIDEFADLMATTGKELESTLARLAAMSRAVGIHLVLATQRPSIDVITGLIKANIPSRIAFMVAGKFDSRIIIDMVGAEKLLGRGDMLFASAWDPFPIRMQGAFVSDEEVEKAVEFVKTLGEPEYIDDEIFIDEEEDDGSPSLFGDEEDDPLFEKALEIVLQQGKASASYIQRRLKVGYNRASRLVELMEEKGIVGPAKGSKPRDLVHNPEVLGAARPQAGSAARVAPSASPRQPSLMPDLETVLGQRVTGKDEEE